jgi:hypothetical protein
VMAAGSVVEFGSALNKVPPQTILTDFLVDLTYPVELDSGASLVARVSGEAVGTHRTTAKGGSVSFLGFRPRDDQSASLGYETRTWFEILKSLGAYPKSRPDVATEDNPAVVSRESPYLATRFPNGTVAVAAHYRTHNETWGGGIHRDAREDEAILAKNPLPSDRLELRAFGVAGYKVDFTGRQLVAFRLDNQRRLAAFGGYECSSIRIDDRDYVFADRPMGHIAWSPLTPDRQVPGGAVMLVWILGEADLKIPLPGIHSGARVFLQGPRPGSVGSEIAASVREGLLQFRSQNGWGYTYVYILPA